jgi:hypothetical protein
MENLREIAFAPSVQMTEIPRVSLGESDETEGELNDIDEDKHKDARYTQYRRDKMVADDDGLVSDSEDDEDHQPQSSTRESPRRNISDRRSSPIEVSEAMEDVQLTSATNVKSIPPIIDAEFTVPGREVQTILPGLVVEENCAINATRNSQQQNPPRTRENDNDVETQDSVEELKVSELADSSVEEANPQVTESAAQAPAPVQD